MIINLIAMIITLTITGMIVYLSFKTKIMQTNLLLLALGIFISIGIHSVIEFLEAINLLSIGVLIILMPILVVIGTIILLIATLRIYQDMLLIIQKLTQMVKDINSGKLDKTLHKEIQSEEAISELVGEFERLMVSLKLAVWKQKDQ